MCFHIGPEFVEALRSKPADRSSLDTPAEVSDATHASSEKEHLARFRRIVSLFRSIFLTVVTIKWILFIVWACL
jgi:hypothetical protein